MLSGELSRFGRVLSFLNKLTDLDCNALVVLKASMYKILGLHLSCRREAWKDPGKQL